MKRSFLCLLLLLVLCVNFDMGMGMGEEKDMESTVNRDALERKARREQWRSASPPGCRRYSDGLNGRFCRIEGKDEDDATVILIGNPSRLREIVSSIQKKGEESVDYEMTADEKAASAVLPAIDAAEGKFQKQEKERQRKWKKEKSQTKGLLCICVLSFHGWSFWLLILFPLGRWSVVRGIHSSSAVRI